MIRIHKGADRDFVRVDGFVPSEGVLGAGFMPIGNHMGVGVLFPQGSGHQMRVWMFDSDGTAIQERNEGMHITGDKVLGTWFGRINERVDDLRAGRVLAVSSTGSTIYVDGWQTILDDDDPSNFKVLRKITLQHDAGATVQKARAVALTAHHTAIEYTTSASSSASKVAVIFAEDGNGDGRAVPAQGGCVARPDLTLVAMERWTTEDSRITPAFACVATVSSSDFAVTVRISTVTDWEPDTWDDLTTTATATRAFGTPSPPAGVQDLLAVGLHSWRHVEKTGDPRVDTQRVTRHHSVLAPSLWIRTLPVGNVATDTVHLLPAFSIGQDDEIWDPNQSIWGSTGSGPRVTANNPPIIAFEGSSSQIENIAIAAGATSAAILKIKYTGQYDIADADPVPLAYLAAPPEVGGLGQQADPPEFKSSSGASETQQTFTEGRFGAIVTGSTSTGKLPIIGKVTIESELRVGGAFGNSHGIESTVDLREIAVGSHEEDYLVYFSAKMYREQYAVIEASDGVLGGEMTLHVPKDPPAFRSVPVSNAAWLNPTDLGKHTPGDPRKYPQSESAAKQRCGGTESYSLGPFSAEAAGGGATAAELDMVQSTFSEHNRRLDIDMSVVVTKSWGDDNHAAGGGAYGGFSYGKSWETRASKGMTLTSYVGNVPAAFPNETYQWGAVMCKTKLSVQHPGWANPSDFEVWALQHWVTDYNGAGPVVDYGPAKLNNPIMYRDRGLAPQDFKWEATMDSRGAQELVIEAIGAHDVRRIPLTLTADHQQQSYNMTADPGEPPLLHSGIPYRWRVEQTHDGAVGDRNTPWGYFVPHAVPQSPLDTATPIVEQDGSISWWWPQPPNADPGWTYHVEVSDSGGALVDEGSTADRWFRSTPLPPGRYTLNITASNPTHKWDPNANLSGQGQQIDTDILVDALLVVDEARPKTSDPVTFEAFLAGPTSFQRATWRIEGEVVEGVDGAILKRSFDRPGMYIIEADVYDTQEAKRTVARSIVVQNRAPVVTLDFPGFVQTLSNVEYGATAEDPDGDSDLLMYTWDLGEQGVVGSGMGLADPPYQFQRPGPHVVCLTVGDGRDNTTRCTSVYVHNTPPSVFLVAPEEAWLYDEVSFMAEPFDPDGAIVHVDWDFGDGHYSGNTSPNHVFTTPTTHEVCLRVVDDFGGEATDCAHIEIKNQDPVANFTFEKGRYTLEPVQFGDASWDPENEIVAHHWSFDDGNFSTAVAPAHSYADNGTYKVCLTVTDRWGATGTGCHDVTVLNRAPDLAYVWERVNASGLLLPGVAMGQYSVVFRDQSTDQDGTVDQWLWEFGDGFAPSQQREQGHTFQRCGVYDVRLTVWDNDGGTNTTVFPVAIHMLDADTGRLTAGGVQVEVPGIATVGIEDPQNGQGLVHAQACPTSDPILGAGVG